MMNEILKTLALLMEQKGYSENRLAQVSGVPQTTINSLFLKNNLPSIETLGALCGGLEIKMSEFYELVEFNRTYEIQEDQDHRFDFSTQKTKDKTAQFTEKYLRLTSEKKALVESIVDALLEK